MQSSSSFKTSSGLDWPRLTAFRHAMHQHPEPGFGEFETVKSVRAHLAAIGVQEKYIRTCAKTGIVVDIENPDGPEPKGEGISCIALRGDMDALLMKQENDLPYRSQTAYAHMCGHDGHTTCLLGIAEHLMARRAKLPKNKRVRLLFQPAEQGPGGAGPMIKEGCLEGVDQVYGYHNQPSYPVGMLAVQPGEMMASVACLKIVLNGKGGHGSSPHLSVTPIGAACDIYKALSTLPSLEVNCKEKVVVSITKLNSGSRNNVIPRTAELEGTIRCFNSEVMEFVKKRVQEIVHSIAKAYRLEVDTTEPVVSITYPAVLNHKAQAEHVARVAEATFGKDRVTAEGLPWFASEDFSEFILEKPGAFFFLGSNPGAGEAPMCHSSYFDYPDELTPIATEMWAKLVEDRLGVQLG